MTAFLFFVGMSGLWAAPQKTAVEITVDVAGSPKTVIIELDEVNAPQTCANFRKLCSAGFYNGIAFHRVIPNYIVQVGDPLTKDASKRGLWGTGGPGYTLTPEFGQAHVPGAVAMARLGDAVNPKKESNGSQFYFCLDTIESLDGDYTVFGKVVSGMEHVIAIGNLSADQASVPNDRVEIRKTRVVGGAPPAIRQSTGTDNGRSLTGAPKPAPENPEPAALNPDLAPMTDFPADDHHFDWKQHGE